jgi:hypothetical protein
MQLTELYNHQEKAKSAATSLATKIANALRAKGFKVTEIAYISTGYDALIRLTFEGKTLAEKFKEAHSSVKWPTSPADYLEYKYMEATRILHGYISSELELQAFRSEFLAEVTSKKAASTASPALGSTPSTESPDNITISDSRQASPSQGSPELMSRFFAGIAAKALKVQKEDIQPQATESTPLTAVPETEQAEFRCRCVML